MNTQLFSGPSRFLKHHIGSQPTIGKAAYSHANTIRVHCLQHESFVGPGMIESWANEKGHVITKTRFYEDDELPFFDSIDWLVILGGTMCIYEEDQYPWLADEKKYIKKAIDAGKPVLGIGLGAQLISSVTGGRVRKNPYDEIGWFPISMAKEAKSSPIFSAMPEHFMAFQWHRDTFSIPPGAMRLASSEACRDQAFEIGSAVGVQFHPESSIESIKRLIDGYGNLPSEGPYVQKPGMIRAGYGYLDEQSQVMRLLLDRIENKNNHLVGYKKPRIKA